MSEHKLADSATIFGITSKGWPASFTVHFEEGVNMAARLGELIGDLEKLKVTPGVVLRMPPQAPVIAPTSPAPQAEEPKAPGDRPATDYPDFGEFESTEITYKNDAGKVTYSIKGPIPFHKFGITAYPEMLDDKGIDFQTLKETGTLPFKAKVSWYKNAKGYKHIKSITVIEQESIPW